MLVQLQYLRALAALMVVYFHSVLQYDGIYGGSLLKGFLFGETGVDLFFVLSGFVMWLTTAGREQSPPEFYRKRVERIVPLYWGLTLAAAAIALLFPAYLKSTVFDGAHVLASLFFIPWTNAADTTGAAITPVVIPGWTLNYEMYFYLIFGALLLFGEKVRIYALALTLIVLLVIFNFMPGESVAARFYGNPIILEFLAGVIVSRLYLSGLRLPQALARLLLPASAVALVAFDGADLDLPRVIGAGLPSVAIVYCLVSMDFSRLREMKFLHLLGDASYSLYLTHVFTLVAVRIGTRLLPVSWFENEIIFISVCMVSSVIVALLFYRGFEVPVARFLRSLRGGKKKVVAGTGPL